MSQIQILTPGQVTTLLAYVLDSNGTPAKQLLGRRNHSLLLCMLDAGLRSNEVRQLSLEDLYWQGDPRESLQIPSAIAKYGEGGHIPASPRLRASLRAYAQAYGLDTAGYSGRPAFYGRDPLLFLSNRQLRRIVNKAGRLALDRHTWCHLMRHIFGDGLRGVADIGTRMRLMRHKDVRSTMVYDHPTDTDTRAAIAAMAAKRQETAP